MLQTVLVKPRSLCQPGQGIVVRVLCFKQGVHFHYVASWPGYLSGPKPFEENVKVGCGWSTFCGSNFFYCPKNLDVTLKNYFIESTNVKVGGGWSTFCSSNFFSKKSWCFIKKLLHGPIKSKVSSGFEGLSGTILPKTSLWVVARLVRKEKSNAREM